MTILRNIAIAVLAISLLTFVALFGRLPALRRTPIGWLQRVLCLYIPNSLRRLDNNVTNGQMIQISQSWVHYLFYQRNPIVLIIFLSLLTGSSFLFLWNALPLLPTKLIPPIPLVLPLPYIFTYLSVVNKAHYVTRSTHRARMSDYPYDHLLFRPRMVCPTCRLIKPARSKHCSLCGVCVAKCDHHCPWINNCVGLGNYAYFLGILLSLTIVEVYGTYLSWWILSPYIRMSPSTPFFSRARLDDFGDSLVVAVNVGGLSIAGVGILASSTAALPLGLLIYHIYLIWAGMTTNESQKWSDWKYDIADGCVFSANRQDLQRHLQHRDGPSYTANEHFNPALEWIDELEEARVNWPIRSDKILVTTTDGYPPQGQETLWNRVRSLRDVENIYDLGARRNFVEVFKGR